MLWLELILVIELEQWQWQKLFLDPVDLWQQLTKSLFMSEWFGVLEQWTVCFVASIHDGRHLLTKLVKVAWSSENFKPSHPLPARVVDFAPRLYLDQIPFLLVSWLIFIGFLFYNGCMWAWLLWYDLDFALEIRRIEFYIGSTGWSLSRLAREVSLVQTELPWQSQHKRGKF